ncbi:hypothetical protein [Dactylosporangium sp. NPDC051484]|uniref:hypothetical protein n=1 Tax=Dactylosporangium sp. NPDC051484 TaxID=3154942 RepID=UPI00344C4B1E
MPSGSMVPNAHRPGPRADSPWALSWMITSIDTDFTVTNPPESVEQIENLARRCAAAIRA